jgi:formylglycine-generating enzyme required for sulfatase activity
MKNQIRRWRKGLLIGFCAVFISTLGIQASDEFSGVAGRLSGAVIESEGVCGKYAEPIMFGSHTICMDIYEASPATSCLYDQVTNQLETETNLAVAKCTAVSLPETMPWGFVTYTQAKQLCARSGKRLPTNKEWYEVAIGFSDTAPCFKTSATAPSKAGSANCVTPTGVHDLVGNMWEWMEEVVSEGGYKERALPESGYVQLVDNEGVVIETALIPNSSFGQDYAWVNKSGVRGFLRGGFYGSGKDGGVFSQNASVALDFASVGVGFRCVKDL